MLTPSGSKVSPRGGRGRPWRMRPAVRRPANHFSTRRENLIDSSHAPGHRNSHAIGRHSEDDPALNDAVAIHATRRVKTDAVRVHARSSTELHRAEPHRPRLSVAGRKCPHCSRMIRFIRFDWRMMNLPHGIGSRLRGGRFLEPVLADPQVKLRARQPKPTRGFRFVSPAFLQDLGNRGVFECAQLSGVVAR